jgi:hypothetical protein
MFDRELVCSILTQISDAIETIQTRCKDGILLLTTILTLMPSRFIGLPAEN